MARPQVTSIIGDLQHLDLDADELLELVKALGLDVAWDESVNYHAIQDVLAAVQAAAAASAAAESAEVAALAAFKADVDAQFAAILALLQGPPPSPATQIIVSITTTTGGTSTMPVTISIDDTGAHADFSWADDHGDPVPAPLDDNGGAFVVTLASDTPTVATLAADPSIPTRFDFTEVALGTGNVVTNVVDSLGNPAVWPATSVPALAGTPITDAPVGFEVVAGPAGELVTTASA